MPIVFFEQPAESAIAKQPIRQRRSERTDATEHVVPRQQPVGEPEAVVGHVGRLRFKHQPRNIDARRTFQAALLAIDAQVGDRFELIGQFDRRARGGR